MLKVLILLGCVALSLGYPYGAPPEVCVSMTPGHYPYSPQGPTSKPQFTITVSSAGYMPGDNILVTLNATRPDMFKFRGFLIMARRADCSGEDLPIGRFFNAEEDPQIQVKTCRKGIYSHNAVTHTSRDEKSYKSFLWNNPEGGDVYFKFTVVNQKSTYWTNIRTGVVYDFSKTPGDSSCADSSGILVQPVDPSRLTTRAPPTTMYPWDNVNETVIVWPSSGAPGTAISISVMVAIAAHLFL